MKKISVLLMFIISIFMLAGCGAGDNYEGKWIGYIESDSHINDRVEILEIGKNGDNYLINKTVGHYDKIIKGGFVTKMSCRAAWVLENSAKDLDTGIIEDGKLLTVPAMGIGYTYIQKDKTLLDSKSKVLYSKYTKERFEKYKDLITQNMHKRYKDLEIISVEELKKEKNN